MQVNDIELFIPLELIEMYHYMEMYIKYKFYKQKYLVHNQFENEEYKKGLSELEGKTARSNLKNLFFEEIIGYHELKDNSKIDEYENIVSLFIPNMAFQTTLHILLVINKFTKLETLKTTFKNKFDTFLKTFEKY